ncbi:hypothetical protein GJ496_000527 [Pomphorhynchus laevis]|nr:hypothetical protein GJ496_000527 [Pomphorhynchus laevis]
MSERSKNSMKTNFPVNAINEMTSIISSRIFKSLAFACGVSFLGYCVYFDQKRRSAPDFKEKLIIKRLEAAERKQNSTKLSIDFELPDITCTDSMHNFLTSNITLADTAYASSDFSSAGEYYAIALACTPMSTNLFEIISQAVNPETVEIIQQKLPLVRKRFRDMLESSSRFKLIMNGAQEGMREASMNDIVLTDGPE